MKDNNRKEVKPLKVKINMDITEFLVTFFLGFLGIHRFMKEYKTSGIIWLCTAGLFGIGWLIDIIYVVMDKELIMPK